MTQPDANKEKKVRDTPTAFDEPVNPIFATLRRVEREKRRNLQKIFRFVAQIVRRLHETVEKRSDFIHLQ